MYRITAIEIETGERFDVDPYAFIYKWIAERIAQSLQRDHSDVISDVRVELI